MRHRRPKDGVPISALKDFQYIAGVASEFLGSVCDSVGVNCIGVISIIMVVVLTFVLPDLSHKIKLNRELNSMKNVLDAITNEVKRAEVACVTTADEVSLLQNSVRDTSTETPKRELHDLSTIVSSNALRKTRSEPVHVEKKVGFFRRIFFPHRNTSHKEIAIMSYIYTDSFDAGKPQSKDLNVSPECS